MGKNYFQTNTSKCIELDAYVIVVCLSDRNENNKNETSEEELRKYVTWHM